MSIHSRAEKRVAQIKRKCKSATANEIAVQLTVEGIINPVSKKPYTLKNIKFLWTAEGALERHEQAEKRAKELKLSGQTYASVTANMMAEGWVNPLTGRAYGHHTIRVFTLGLCDMRKRGRIKHGQTAEERAAYWREYYRAYGERYRAENREYLRQLNARYRAV